MALPAHAALLIIGNEILSGRTQETNLAVLAECLHSRGVQLAETRIVRDEVPEIVAALNSLRNRYRYVFTSGGIGPTHDDLTTAAVAKAFAVPVTRHPEAEDNLREHYQRVGKEATAARLRMADTPQGAVLVPCAHSVAAGYRLANVFVFAGVPVIFAAMAEAAMVQIEQQAILNSCAIEVAVSESEVADPLSKLQERYPSLEIGSYPKLRAQGNVVQLVLSGREQQQLDLALAELTATLDGRDIAWLKLS